MASLVVYGLPLLIVLVYSGFARYWVGRVDALKKRLRDEQPALQDETRPLHRRFWQWSIPVAFALVVWAVLTLPYPGDIGPVLFAHEKSLGYDGRKILFGILGAVLPPLWFIVEWTQFASAWTKEERDAYEHTQDLLGQLWLGLVAAMLVLFQIK